MDFLPINIRVCDQDILIVGGGRVASHKAGILSRFTDRVVVVAPVISDAIKALPFRSVERAFEAEDLDGVRLVFICTENRELNRSILMLAHTRGVLASVCDSPAECDFTSPAIFSEGNLTIAVASDAKDVKRSIRVRNQIKEAIENGIIHID